MQIRESQAKKWNDPLVYKKNKQIDIDNVPKA